MAFVVVALDSPGQTYGEIRGRVIALDGQGASNAEVTIRAVHGGPRRFQAVVATDASGNFVFPFVPAHTEYHIQALRRAERSGASGRVAAVLAAARTVVIAELHSMASENGDCGGFHGYRDIPPGVFIWPNEPAMQEMICL